VRYLLDRGVIANKRLSLQELIEMAEQTELGNLYEYPNEDSSYTNSVDSKRREVMEFIEKHKDLVLPQFGCDGNCFAHPDALVLMCWMQIKGELP